MYFVGLASPSRHDAAPLARSKLLLPRFCSGLAAPRYQARESLCERNSCALFRNHCWLFSALSMVCLARPYFAANTLPMTLSMMIITGFLLSMMIITGFSQLQHMTREKWDRTQTYIQSTHGPLLYFRPPQQNPKDS